MFRHAPISACAMAICAATSFLSKSSVGSRRATPPPFWAQLAFPLASVPDLLNCFCVLAVFYQLRVIERRWGSSKFLTFVVWISLVNFAAGLVFSASRGTASAVIAPLVALATRYYLELPALGESRIPVLFHVTVTEKLLLFSLVTKVILFPGAAAGELTLVSRIMIGVVGAASSYFAKNVVSAQGTVGTPSVLQRFLDAVEATVIRPLWDRVLSLPFRNSLSVRRVVRRKPMPRTVADAVPEEILDQIAAMEGQRRPRNRIPHTGTPTPATGPQPIAAATRRVDSDAIRLIEELHLGVSRDEIAHALEMTGGNVDNAVTILLGGSD